MSTYSASCVASVDCTRSFTLVLPKVMIEDARREIHGSREQARERQDGQVLGRIRGPAPGVEFLPARAFAAQHVGPRAPQPVSLTGSCATIEI